MLNPWFTQRIWKYRITEGIEISMEGSGRGQQPDLGIPNSIPYNQSNISSLKLPLVDTRRNAPVSVRRGASIFSPNQTLDQPHKDSRNQNPPPPPQPTATDANASIRYRECLKNHAASMGGHVVDGCGEFMPTGDEGTAEYLRCAACNCHRNFHRREAEGEQQQQQQQPHYYSYNRTPQTQSQTTYAVRKHSHPTMFNFGAGAESSSEDLNIFQTSGGGEEHVTVQPSRKRFRTKFNQDQKDRMQEFASKIGWRIQKQDEEEVHQFCNEVGVKRQVFKVWMHNNKQAMKKMHNPTNRGF